MVIYVSDEGYIIARNTIEARRIAEHFTYVDMVLPDKKDNEL